MDPGPLLLPGRGIGQFIPVIPGVIPRKTPPHPELGHEEVKDRGHRYLFPLLGHHVLDGHAPLELLVVVSRVMCKQGFTQNSFLALP